GPVGHDPVAAADAPLRVVPQQALASLFDTWTGFCPNSSDISDIHTVSPCALLEIIIAKVSCHNRLVVNLIRTMAIILSWLDRAKTRASARRLTYASRSLRPRRNCLCKPHGWRISIRRLGPDRFFFRRRGLGWIVSARRIPKIRDMAVRDALEMDIEPDQ